MTIEEAQEYHLPTCDALKNADVDVICAASILYPEEAAGIVSACSKL